MSFDAAQTIDAIVKIVGGIVSLVALVFSISAFRKSNQQMQNAVISNVDKKVNDLKDVVTTNLEKITKDISDHAEKDLEIQTELRTEVRNIIKSTDKMQDMILEIIKHDRNQDN